MRPAGRDLLAALALAFLVTGRLEASGREDWLAALPGPDAFFAARHQLSFPSLDGSGFLAQLLAVLGTAPVLVLLGVLAVAPLGAFASRSTEETVRGFGLLVITLVLAFLVPCTLSLTVILALEGNAGSLDMVVGSGLVAVAVVYAIPLGLMVRQRRLHKGAGLLELLGAPLLPLAALGLHAAGLQVGEVTSNPAVAGLYQATLAAGEITPVWVALELLGGGVLLAGLLLAPVALQGFPEALVALKARLEA
jgi:hypothetical protein